jgi:hypothetical protein
MSPLEKAGLGSKPLSLDISGWVPVLPKGGNVDDMQGIKTTDDTP